MRLGIVIGAVGMLLACDGAAGPDAGGEVDARAGDGGVASVLVRAAEGGVVRSRDGVFSLYVPPGALDADTTLSVRVLARSEWSAEAAATEVDGEIYRVEPSGTTFDPPAWAHWILEDWDETTPYVDSRMATPGGVVEEPEVHLLVGNDGAYELASPIPHLTDLWRVRHPTLDAIWTLPRTRSPDLPDVVAAVGESWELASGWSIELTPPVRGGTIVRGGLVALGGPGPVGVDAPESWPRGELYFNNVPADSPMVGRLSAPTDAPASLHLDATARWRCLAAGPGQYWFGPVLTQNDGTRDRTVYYLDPAFATCGEVPATDQQASVLLADVCRATRVGDALECAPTPSTSANVIQPTAAVEASFSTTSSESSIFEGVTSWESVAGPPAITLASSLQTATATHDGSRYAITGLVSGGAFAATDTLTVTGTPPGASAPVIVSVTPPAALDGADDVLGALDGLSTEMHFADGAFDAMYVYAIATGSAMAGEAGVIRIVPASAMTLAGSVRTAPLLDAATIAALDARGLTITQVTVGPIAEVGSSDLFPGRSTPVQAGRFVQVAAADLVATPTGGTIVRDCSALPATFPPLDPESTDPRIAIVCVDDADAYCRASNDLYEDDPLLPAQCAGAERAVHLNPDRTTGAPMACPGSGGGWLPVWSSRGIYGASHCMYAGGAVGEAQFFEVQRVSDGARRRVGFRTSGPGTVEVTAVESDPTGPYPPYGAQHSCREASITFPAPSDPTLPHATIQLNNVPGSCVPCLVNGDTSVTPEVETGCGNVASFQLLYTEAGVRSAGFSAAGGSTGWSVESASAGTIVAPRRVIDFPADTDVTAVVTNGTQRWQLVFRHTSSNEYVVSAITRL